MRRILVIVGVLLIGLTVTPSAHAQGCKPDAFRQADLAGIYVDPASPMRVEIYPCGGVLVTWDNDYGRHTAGYYSFDRLIGHGVMAAGIQTDPLTGAYLDGSHKIALKAGEPGYIHAATFTPYDDTVRVYKLRKIA